MINEILLGGSVITLLASSVGKIPEYHFGVVSRLGKRTGKIVREGVYLKIPLLDSVELISLELVTLPISASFTSQDRVQLIVRGSLQYRPDPDISRDGKNVFVEMSEETIRTGIEDAIQAKLGGLGGVYESDDFIKNRQALGQIINCLLRMSVPPHLRHDFTTCGVLNCRMKSQIDAQNLLKFYNKHWQTVKKQVDDEKKYLNDKSRIEERYGIDIETFELAEIDFSEETKSAFEKERQAEARAKAFNKKMEMAIRARKELGASAQEALNAADISLEPSITKRIVSVEGNGQAIVLDNFLGGMRKKESKKE